MEGLTISEKVRILAGRRGKTLAALAEATGQSPQNFTKKLARNSLSEQELHIIAEACGVEYSRCFRLPDGTEL